MSERYPVRAPPLITGTFSAMREFPEQTIENVWLNDAPGSKWNHRDGLLFGELDALSASELLADLADLTS